ncbi:MAG: DUF1501 domain-containing protein [Pseudobdellovibrionaceae bacterium]
MKRRDLLLKSSLMGAGLLVLPRISFANSPMGFAKNFVMIQVQDGWDVTLSLDPKTHKDHNTKQEDIFIEYSEDQIAHKAGDIRLAPAAAPIAEFSNEMSVVNGVILAPFDVGHSGCLSYITTGNSEGKAPVLPIEFANLLGQSPLGVITNEAISPLNRPVLITASTNVASIVEDGNSLNLKAPRRGAFTGSFQRLMQMSNRLEAAKTQFEKLGFDSQKRRESGNVGKLLASVFSAGLSNSALLDVSADLDTHSNHPGTHLQNQTKAWEEIANIFKTFRSVETTNGRNLFDDTLFMVVSEFARTPALNTSKGKDHNPLTNSVLFAGGLVRGGQSLGHSHVITAENSTTGSSQHTALPIHIETLQAARTSQVARDDKYIYITPEVIAATAGSILRLNPADVKSVDMNKTFILSSLLK